MQKGLQPSPQACAVVPTLAVVAPLFQDVVRLELAGVRQAAEGITSSTLRLKQDIAGARNQLQEEQTTTE